MTRRQAELIGHGFPEILASPSPAGEADDAGGPPVDVSLSGTNR